MKVTIGREALKKVQIKRSVLSGKNIDFINVNFGDKKYRIIFAVYTAVITFLWCFSNIYSLRNGVSFPYFVVLLLINLLITPLTLTLHELLHAAAALVCGIKPEILAYLPNGLKNIWKVTYPVGIMVTENIPARVFKRYVFLLFPLLFMAVIPAVLAIFIPAARFILIMFAALQALSCALDVQQSVVLFINRPKGFCCISGNNFIIPRAPDSTVSCIEVVHTGKLVVREWKINARGLREIEPDVSDDTNTANCIRQIERERAEGAWWTKETI